MNWIDVSMLGPIDETVLGEPTDYMDRGWDQPKARLVPGTPEHRTALKQLEIALEWYKAEQDCKEGNPTEPTPTLASMGWSDISQS